MGGVSGSDLANQDNQGAAGMMDTDTPGLPDVVVATSLTQSALAHLNAGTPMSVHFTGSTSSTPGRRKTQRDSLP